MEIQDDIVWDQNTEGTFWILRPWRYGPQLCKTSKSRQVSIICDGFSDKKRHECTSIYFRIICNRWVSSSQIFPLFWKAVAILELTCKFKAIATVSDGTLQNAFYKMHSLLSDEDNPDLPTFKTRNIYVPDRYIWFFCDHPI